MSYEWSTEKPDRCGVYGVRTSGDGFFSAFQGVVEVVEEEEELYVNLHEKNTNDDLTDWSLVADCSEDFEWCWIAQSPFQEVV